MHILFDVFPVIFMVMFLTVFGLVFVTIIRQISQWHKNNKAPRLSVEATVVAKRYAVSRHNGTGHNMAHTYTTYYATFQVSSGDRMELVIPENQYGFLVEGDYGQLAFQGTRFLSFQRR